MNSLISADNTWALWCILAVCAAMAIYLEQKYEWASKVTGCILALSFVMILSNFNIIPTEAPVYDHVWGYIVPLAIPMLLFNADIKRIGRESGRMVLIFLLSSFGTVAGGFIAYYMMKDVIPQLNDIVPMFTGTYTGGAVNFVAMSTLYKVPGKTVSVALVADNLLMALYFFVLIALPTLSIIKRKFTHPYIDKLENLTEEDKSKNETLVSKYWGAKEISLKDIAMTVALSLVIVTISDTLSKLLSSTFSGKGIVDAILGGLLGNKYLLMTTLTIIIASVFPKQVGAIRGSQEIGTFLIYLFFAVIGAPASITLILKESPLLFIFAFIIILVNLIFSLVLGKLFKFSIEEIIIASNANIGGPTSAAAMAVSKGWTELIVPALLIGTLGYVIGNYYGIFTGWMLH